MTAMKTRAGRSNKTPEQHKAERETLLAQLDSKVSMLTSSEGWLAYLQFAKAFRRYSLNNMMLIQMQRPDATHVAGFRKWQELGRQVRKGERAIKIMGYSSRKVSRANPETGEMEESRIPTFPILSVFDISQTDGEPVPDPHYELPNGETHADTLARLEFFLTVEGWTIEREELRPGLEGYTAHLGRRIVLSNKLPLDAQLAVLIHEGAHALLHEDNGAYVAHRGVCETEAESTAYVVAGLVGLDLNASSITYIAGWAASKPEAVKDAAANVLRAINWISAGLGLDGPQGPEGEAS